MSEINSQALREAAEQAMHDDWGFDADLFHELVTPSIVLELLELLMSGKETSNTSNAATRERGNCANGRKAAR